MVNTFGRKKKIATNLVPAEDDGRRPAFKHRLCGRYVEFDVLLGLGTSEVARHRRETIDLLTYQVDTAEGGNGVRFRVEQGCKIRAESHLHNGYLFRTLLEQSSQEREGRFRRRSPCCLLKVGRSRRQRGTHVMVF